MRLVALNPWIALVGWNKQVTTTVHADNVAMVQVTNTGKNPTIRELGKPHGCFGANLSFFFSRSRRFFVSFFSETETAERNQRNSNAKF